MPSFKKVSHTSFSVSDAERSARFWRETFGFQDIEAVSGDGWHGTVMVHPATATVLEVQQHDANGGEAFDPARTGFDHLGLLVEDPAELDVWGAHFEQLGVVHSPVVHREYGSVLTFKDPDGIQFEMFFRAGHP
ncbi:MAG TPA: VOC family protein [Acidimicrobiales bacterium]|nr:VOC family protein [Acidimicrobiales bacterium]